MRITGVQNTFVHLASLGLFFSLACGSVPSPQSTGSCVFIEKETNVLCDFNSCISLSVSSLAIQRHVVSIVYDAVVTTPRVRVCDLIVVEVPVQSHNCFLDQRSRKVIV